MDNYMKVKNSMLTFLLEQMGAKIHRITGIVCYVEFTIHSVIIKYMYHLDKKNKYFLERISPYNVAIGQFEKEEDVINTIKIDISKFENAKNSNKFNKFINTGKDFVDTVKSFEDLYLHYNVSKYDLADIQQNIESLKEKLEEVSIKADMVYDKPAEITEDE
ncbi:hypothetical protein HYI18_12270 [Clostridium botulinum]|uniref:hypothetical protein n=1 Tax=Clostridium botulinum TaxID=1491 RepID=UPI00174B2BCE|nr:hypothetical protein [Clostridium botulinum]MBD5639351.1 hypothetical protein [Clostridium botulinum]